MGHGDVDNVPCSNPKGGNRYEEIFVIFFCFCFYLFSNASIVDQAGQASQFRKDRGKWKQFQYRQ